MKVLLKRNWFAPTEPHILPAKAGRPISGHLYPKGEVLDLAEDLRAILPSDAVVLDDDQAEAHEEHRRAKAESPDTLGALNEAREADFDRAGSESLAEAEESAEERRKRQSRESLVKARAVMAERRKQVVLKGT